jgi:magnesium-transporting ATPase (P-type)
MFEHAKAAIVATTDTNIPHSIIRTIRIGEQLKQILKINEYESRFQSMSVMFWCEKKRKYFVAVKGNPEMIHHYAAKRVEGFEQFIKKLSLDGYRSIAFGLK